MQKAKLFMSLAFLLGSTFLALAAPSSNVDVTNLLKTVATRWSTSSNFEAALKSLDRVETDQHFWLQPAAGELLEPNRRRKCVKYLFEHMDVQGLTLEKLLQSLNAPVNWISVEKIVIVPPYGSGERRPKSLLESPKVRSIAFVPILTEMRGDYRLGVYVGFGADVNESELREAFRTGTATNSIRDVPVIGFEKFDTDDVESKYPGDAWRAITW